MSDRQRFTSVVRRGMRQLLELGLADNVEKRIANGNAAHLKRSERMPATEAAELRAAIAWIRQEAAEDVEPLCDACGDPAHEGACEDDTPAAEAQVEAGELF